MPYNISKTATCEICGLLIDMTVFYLEVPTTGATLHITHAAAATPMNIIKYLGMAEHVWVSVNGARQHPISTGVPNVPL